MPTLSTDKSVYSEGEVIYLSYYNFYRSNIRPSSDPINVGMVINKYIPLSDTWSERLATDFLSWGYQIPVEVIKGSGNDWTVRGQVAIKIIEDNKTEGSESFSFYLPDYANNSISITVLDTSVFDVISPTISISASKNILNIGETAIINFSLSESSVNFALDDIILSSGTLSQFTGSGSFYTAVYTPETNTTGEASILVWNHAFSDTTGNTNTDGQDNDNQVLIKINTKSTPKYSFIGYSSSMNEGITNGMVVQTTNVAPGTVLTYSISGIAADRLTSGSLQGTTTVDANGQARIDLGVLANNRTDSPTTAVVTVGNNLASASVVINDTSLTPTITPKYSFIGYSSSMNEGITNGMVVQTTNVAPGTVLTYSISGIAADRLTSGSLQGTTTVDANGQARIDFGVIANNRTDGITTAGIKLGNNLAIASVIVNDTSLTPVGKPTYSFIEYSSSINEGQSNGLVIQTTSVTPGTVLNYSISGITADRISSGSLQGSTTVDSNGQALIDIGVLANNRKDGSNVASVVVGNNLASISFEINDTSLTPIDSEIILSDNVNPFMVSTPNLKINGTSLVDKVFMPLDSSGILINSEGSQITVVDSSGILGNTTLTNIERIYFNDISLAFDTTGVAGQAYRIYEAVLGRAPDLGGLGYWINDMDNGVSLTTIAAGFIASKEFQDKYGVNPSYDTYVNLLYKNILGRDPDSEGLNYWVSNMQKGIDTPAAVLASFSEGYENKANVAPDIANGIYYSPWIN